jgi:hypothetical protein
MLGILFVMNPSFSECLSLSSSAHICVGLNPCCESSNSISSKILFDKKSVQWDGNNGWTASSKTYLKEHKDLEVKAVFTEYQQLIKEFYGWFYKKVSSVYANELKEIFNNKYQISRLNQIEEEKIKANAMKQG